MRHMTFLALLGVSCVAMAAPTKERPNTVLIHPGEVLYATFQEKGNDLVLANVTKEKTEAAQLVLTMHAFDPKDQMLMLKVESRFKKDMQYKAEMRMLSTNRRADTSVLPVMAGKMSFESWAHPIEELALYGFILKD